MHSNNRNGYKLEAKYCLCYGLKHYISVLIHPDCILIKTNTLKSLFWMILFADAITHESLSFKTSLLQLLMRSIFTKCSPELKYISDLQSLESTVNLRS